MDGPSMTHTIKVNNLITKFCSTDELFFITATKELEYRVGTNELTVILQQLYKNNNGNMIQELQLYCEAYGILL